MNNNPKINDETLEVLQEILKWTKVASIQKTKEVLETELSTKEKKLVYHHSDGNKKTRDFGEIAGISRANTISDLWKQWKALGIVEMVSVRGGERAKRSFNLKDFGIEVPIIIKTSEPKKETTQEVKENQAEQLNNAPEVQDGQEFPTRSFKEA